MQHEPDCSAPEAPRRAKVRPQAGFTLLEMLVVLVIAGCMALGIAVYLDLRNMD